MSAPKIELTLIPAPDDPPLRSSEYQRGLRRFADALSAEGIKFGFSLDLIEAATPTGEISPPVFLGTFTFAKALVTAVAGFVVAWLKGRSKRKVRLAIGSDGRVSAEAQTAEEVEKLLNKAVEYQQAMKEIGKKRQKTKPKTAARKSPRKR